MPSISPQHKCRFAEIKTQLARLGSQEAVFIREELLFFEVLAISLLYGDDPQDNSLLADLQYIQANEYAAATAPFAKARQREKVIRQFLSTFKTVLTKATGSRPAQIK